MSNLVINIFECGCKAVRKHTKTMGFAFGVPRAKGNNMPVSITLTNEQEVDVTLKITTETGKPAPVDGKPTWEVLSGSSTVTVSEDGLSAVVRSGDDPGDTQIIVKADANLGEGVEEISDAIKVSVQSATAMNLGLSVGTPRTKV